MLYYIGYQLEIKDFGANFKEPVVNLTVILGK